MSDPQPPAAPATATPGQAAEVTTLAAQMWSAYQRETDPDGEYSVSFTLAQPWQQAGMRAAARLALGISREQLRHAERERDEAREQLAEMRDKLCEQQTVDAATYRTEVDRITAQLAEARQQRDTCHAHRERLNRELATLTRQLNQMDRQLAAIREHLAPVLPDGQWLTCTEAGTLDAREELLATRNLIRDAAKAAGLEG